MTRYEHLMIVLIEECAEVQQAASKALRFGLYDKETPTSVTNLGRLKAELNDLIAMVEMVEQDQQIRINRDEELISAKQRKVEKFLKLSARCGTLTSEQE